MKPTRIVRKLIGLSFNGRTLFEKPTTIPVPDDEMRMIPIHLQHCNAHQAKHLTNQIVKGMIDLEMFSGSVDFSELFDTEGYYKITVERTHMKIANRKEEIGNDRKN